MVTASQTSLLMLFGPQRDFLLQYCEWPLGRTGRRANSAVSTKNLGIPLAAKDPPVEFFVARGKDDRISQLYLKETSK